MKVEKINRRSEKRDLQRRLRNLLERSAWSKGVPGRCEGARPNQLRAGAKVLADRLFRMRREHSK